jgi:hypothetical protein
VSDFPARHADTGRYEIRVAGHLDARWADWFDGMTLTPEPDGTTVLDGSVADQAALHGLLRTLRDLGLPLMSVTQANTQANAHPASPTATDNQPGA